MGVFALEVSDANFENEVLKSEKPVLVDFWAEWCGPCRMIGPSIEAVAEEMKDSVSVLKMNVDENMNVPQRYGVRGIPTLIVFKDGEEKERIVGAVSKEAIEQALKRQIS